MSSMPLFSRSLRADVFRSALAITAVAASFFTSLASPALCSSSPPSSRPPRSSMQADAPTTSGSILSPPTVSANT